VPLVLAASVLGIQISDHLGYLLPALIGIESIGIPSPGETALVLACVLASQGHLSIELVIVIAAASAIVGDNIGYWVGRVAGRRVLTAPGFMYERRVMLIDYGERFFTKHGPKAVFLGRWVALIRVTAAWLAGMNHMPFRQFFFYNALGGITWAVAVGLVAYYLGDAAVHVITRVGVFAAVALAVAVVGGLIYLRLRERRHLRQNDR
jgi:membrane protein DedA with SNARE-associated domain